MPIVSENIRLVGPILFAQLLEELRIFAVGDRLVELWQQGMLPIGRGRAGQLLHEYFKDSCERLTDAERRDLYTRVFGVPGRGANVEPNREFDALWLRFISSVSGYGRQAAVGGSIGRNVRIRLAHCQAVCAARDLAQSLSLHGYGAVHYAATELQATMQTIIDLLSEPEIRNAFGAHDMWQVIDQVNTMHLGGARDVARYRSRATAGTKLINWLADKSDQLRSPCLRLPEIDSTTVDAAEEWLATRTASATDTQ